MLLASTVCTVLVVSTSCPCESQGPLGRSRASNELGSGAQGSPEAAHLQAIRDYQAAGRVEEARRKLSELLPAGASPFGGVQPEERRLTLLAELGQLAGELGDIAAARAAHEERVRTLELERAAADSDLLSAQQDLAIAVARSGDLRGADTRFASIYEARRGALPTDHADTLDAALNLASTRAALGDLERALELQEHVHAVRSQLLEPDDPKLLAAKSGLALTQKARGAWQAAAALERDVLAAYSRRHVADHSLVLRAKGNLANTLQELGDLEGALELKQEVHDGFARTLPPGHRDLLRAKAGLAAARFRLGDLEPAHTLFQEVYEALRQQVPADDPQLLGAAMNLAVARRSAGDLPGALELEESVLDARTRSLPPGHADLLAIQQNVSVTRKLLGDLRGALALQEQVLAAWRQKVGPDDPNVLSAEHALGATRFELGDLQGAHELFVHVHEVRARTLSADHPELLGAKYNLALTLAQRGELWASHQLLSEVYDAHLQRSSPEHPDRLDAAEALAGSWLALGDHARARALLEQVRATRARVLPAGHPAQARTLRALAAVLSESGDLTSAAGLLEEAYLARSGKVPADDHEFLATLGTLAAVRRDLGDLEAALELDLRVVDARSKALAPGHPILLQALESLAVTCAEMGDFAEAVQRFEEVLAAREGILAEDHPARLQAMQNVAAARLELGDAATALRIGEAVLAVRRASLPSAHPELARAMLNVALTKQALGDDDGSIELLEAAYAGLESSVESRHSDLHQARTLLAIARARAGDRDGAAELVDAGLDAAEQLCARGLTLSLREARAAAHEAVRRVAALRVASGGPDRAPAAFFGVLESARHVATARQYSTAQREHEDVTELREALHRAEDRVRAHLVSLPDAADTADGTADAGSPGGRWGQELAVLAVDRDTQESRLVQAIASKRSTLGTIDAATVAASLGEADVAVGITRLAQWDPERLRTDSRPTGAHYVAFVLRHDGRVREVDLGATEQLDLAVEGWRAALGAPLLRGLGRGAAPAATEIEAGRTLRALLFDPIMRVTELEPGSHVFLCLDGSLHAAPVDALPLDTVADALRPSTAADVLRLGDRYSIHCELSFARLVRPEGAPSGAASLLVVGDVDFDAAVVDPTASVALASDAPGRAMTEGSTVRTAPSGYWKSVKNLYWTRAEMETVASLGRDLLDAEATILRRAEVTEEALATSVRGKRFVHVATHGWFMPENVRSVLDQERAGAPGGALGVERTVKGFAPFELCGLVLSGANSASSPESRSSCLLTAQEVSALDLGDCELAVLSACETNVGVARAGEGIQSLMTALHQAGARTTVTSLWQVPDFPSMELMVAFYDELWRHGTDKAAALWAAKRRLREGGAPPLAWAGWVLYGSSR